MRWEILNDKAPTTEIDRTNLPIALRSILLQRGYSSLAAIQEFFSPSLDQLHPPLLMKDMQVAVDRLQQAISGQQKIMILGDYDVDGTTSVAMFSLFLHQFTNQIIHYVPDRYTEGYGVSMNAIDFALSSNVGLIVALDCGIKSLASIAYAKQFGIDFIVCDHHLPGNELPAAVAILNPKQKDCDYPFKELCGCGVGFKFIQAYYQTVGIPKEQAFTFLDLVATAIAADLVPMVGENRVLAYHGLRKLNQNPRPGLRILGRNIKHANWTINDIVFQLAPRINAAGRIWHGILAVDLLMSTEETTTEKYADQIEEFNLQRRELDRLTTIEALELISVNKEENAVTTVVNQSNWNKGVIGIVASRLIETYYRPTVVFTESDGILAASARSVPGFDLYKALESCSEFLLQFGGHQYAAGMTTTAENLPLFKEKFTEYVEQNWAVEEREPVVVIDSCLSINTINKELFRILHQFEPYGPGNHQPVFIDEFILTDQLVETIGQDQSHLRIQFVTPVGQKISAIGFGMGKHKSAMQVGSKIQLVYSLEENHFRGQVYPQLKIRDLRVGK